MEEALKSEDKWNFIQILLKKRTLGMLQIKLDQELDEETFFYKKSDIAFVQLIVNINDGAPWS